MSKVGGRGYTVGPTIKYVGTKAGTVTGVRISNGDWKLQPCEPNVKDCPLLDTVWLAYKSDGPDSITKAEPFSWQGSYVWCHTNLGDRLLAFDEFWDWVKDTSALCRWIPAEEMP